jgi:hypothetical protein
MTSFCCFAKRKREKAATATDHSHNQEQSGTTAGLGCHGRGVMKERTFFFVFYLFIYFFQKPSFFFTVSVPQFLSIVPLFITLTVK